MTTKEDYYLRKAEKKAQRDKKLAESWRYKLNDPLLWFNGLLAVFTLCLVVVAKWTDDTLKDTLFANKLEQRAWVGITDVAILSPLTYSADRKTATINLNVEVENFGRTPATDLFIDLIPLVFDNKFAANNWRKFQSDVCKRDRDNARVREGGPSSDHYLVLPNQKFRAETQFKGRREIKIGDLETYYLMFTGCVTYQTTDKELRQTGLVFTVTAGASKSVDDIKINSKDGNLAGGYLRAVRIYSAGLVN